MKMRASVEHGTVPALPPMTSAPIPSVWSATAPAFPPVLSMPPPSLPPGYGYSTGPSVPNLYAGPSTNLKFLPPAGDQTEDARYSQQKEGRGTGPSADKRCFGCNQTGHFRRDCPNPRSGAKGGPYGNAKPLRKKKDWLASMESSHGRVQILSASRNRWRAVPSFVGQRMRPYSSALRADGRERDGQDQEKAVRSGRTSDTSDGVCDAGNEAGRLDLALPALVSRRVPEVMLGIDWMQQQGVQWCFGTGTVNIHDRQFLLTTRNHAQSCRRLVAVRDTRIPPRSEMNVTARFNVREGLDGRLPSDWATEPMELKEGLLVAGAVLPRRHENLPVRVLNTTSKEIFFPRGSEVARATPVVVEEASEIEPAGRRVCACRSVGGRCRFRGQRDREGAVKESPARVSRTSFPSRNSTWGALIWPCTKLTREMRGR